MEYIPMCGGGMSGFGGGSARMDASAWMLVLAIRP